MILWFKRQFWKIFESKEIKDPHTTSKGHFYLLYSDGSKSAKMIWKTARKYQKMFGGEIKNV